MISATLHNKSYLILGGHQWKWAWSIVFLRILQVMRLCGISICTTESWRLEALASVRSSPLAVVMIHDGSQRVHVATITVERVQNTYSAKKYIMFVNQVIFSRVTHVPHVDQLATTSANKYSVGAEWLQQSGRAPSEPSQTLRWRMTRRLASIQWVAFYITLRSLSHCVFVYWWSPILNNHTGVVANCDHTSEWVHWVRACIGIAMEWVMLRKSLLTFCLPARKMQFSLH